MGRRGRPDLANLLTMPPTSPRRCSRGKRGGGKSWESKPGRGAEGGESLTPLEEECHQGGEGEEGGSYGPPPHRSGYPLQGGEGGRCVVRVNSIWRQDNINLCLLPY